MPDIPATTFADGAAISAATFQNAVYLPHATTPASYEVINGWLDATNMDSTFEVTRRMVQRRQLVEARQVGSTMPLDYFSDLFNGVTVPDDGPPATAEELTSYVPIPGAQLSYYIGGTDPTLMLVSWSISWESDLNAAGAAAIRLAVNGRVSPASGNVYRRVVSRSVWGAAPGIRDCRFANHWSGCAVLDASGYSNNAWNNIGLMISSNALQARVRNRRIGYVRFG